MAYPETLRLGQEALRRAIKRDGALWNLLMPIKQKAIKANTLLNEARWKKESAYFEEKLQEHAARRKDFFFIQIGAHDGSMDDPISENITQYAWRGIFVEPQRPHFDSLVARHKKEGTFDRHHFENAAVDEVSGVRELFKVKDEKIRGAEQTGLASFYSNRALATYAALDQLTSERVSCISLNDLLIKYGVGHIDLLQIDTEGFDAEIIQMIDFGQIAPTFIRYEHRHLKWSEFQRCRKLLSAHGYTNLTMQNDAAAICLHHLG